MELGQCFAMKKTVRFKRQNLVNSVKQMEILFLNCMKRVASEDLFDLTVKKSNSNEAIRKLLPHDILFTS
jgi:hypothetical protein